MASPEQVQPIPRWLRQPRLLTFFIALIGLTIAMAYVVVAVLASVAMVWSATDGADIFSLQTIDAAATGTFGDGFEPLSIAVTVLSASLLLPVALLTIPPIAFFAQRALSSLSLLRLLDSPPPLEEADPQIAAPLFERYPEISQIHESPSEETSCELGPRGGVLILSVNDADKLAEPNTLAWKVANGIIAHEVAHLRNFDTIDQLLHRVVHLLFSLMGVFAILSTLMALLMSLIAPPGMMLPLVLMSAFGMSAVFWLWGLLTWTVIRVHQSGELETDHTALSLTEDIKDAVASLPDESFVERLWNLTHPPAQQRRALLDAPALAWRTSWALPLLAGGFSPTGLILPRLQTMFVPSLWLLPVVLLVGALPCVVMWGLLGARRHLAPAALSRNQTLLRDVEAGVVGVLLVATLIEAPLATLLAAQGADHTVILQRLITPLYTHTLCLLVVILIGELCGFGAATLIRQRRWHIAERTTAAGGEAVTAAQLWPRFFVDATAAWMLLLIGAGIAAIPFLSLQLGLVAGLLAIYLFVRFPSFNMGLFVLSGLTCTGFAVLVSWIWAINLQNFMMKLIEAFVG